MVKKKIEQKDIDGAIIGIAAFWVIQTVLIAGKIAGANISWLGALSPILVVVLFSIIFVLFGSFMVVKKW
jgi:thiol:disulfide interchange protein